MQISPYYQSDRPFEPWLFAIIQNVTSKYLDHNQKRQQVEAQLDELPEVLIEGGSGPELDLRTALEQPPPTQLEALALTKVGLSVAEAASRAGTSIASMKIRAHRAYEFLKRSLLR